VLINRFEERQIVLDETMRRGVARRAVLYISKLQRLILTPGTANWDKRNVCVRTLKLGGRNGNGVVLSSS
jgi:hypothetical protein